PRSLTRRLVSCYDVTAAPLNQPLSLHDALPISETPTITRGPFAGCTWAAARAENRATPTNAMPAPPNISGIPASALARLRRQAIDRKSTRLNSSHGSTSYAVFCLKKEQ